MNIIICPHVLSPSGVHIGCPHVLPPSGINIICPHVYCADHQGIVFVQSVRGSNLISGRIQGIHVCIAVLTVLVGCRSAGLVLARGVAIAKFECCVILPSVKGG